MRVAVHLEEEIDCIQHMEPPAQVTAIELVLETERRMFDLTFIFCLKAQRKS